MTFTIRYYQKEPACCKCLMGKLNILVIKPFNIQLGICQNSMPSSNYPQVVILFTFQKHRTKFHNTWKNKQQKFTPTFFLKGSPKSFAAFYLNCRHGRWSVNVLGCGPPELASCDEEIILVSACQSALSEFLSFAVPGMGRAVIDGKWDYCGLWAQEEMMVTSIQDPHSEASRREKFGSAFWRRLGLKKVFDQVLCRYLKHEAHHADDWTEHER